MLNIETVIIEDPILKAIPQIALGVQLFRVKVRPSSQRISDLQKKIASDLASKYQVDTIRNRKAIEATRNAYKSLGKDPNRYRPSADALSRRVLNGKPLFQINNIVDMINLLSIETGISIGGYDYEKIRGSIRAAIGGDETFVAIGRGNLNISDLPVLIDDAGTFGSPTSDSERTKVTESTTLFLQVAFNFEVTKSQLEPFLKLSEQWHTVYNEAELLDQKIIGIH
jgi:DNA/RNA-binding domain of Phe-tRNA-synthetase-like protein